MENLEKEISKILERNKKVENDKAWETSLIRRIILGFLTYAFSCLWLWMINENLILLKSFVPVLGYIISTLTLQGLKRWWLNKNGI